MTSVRSPQEKLVSTPHISRLNQTFYCILADQTQTPDPYLLFSSSFFGRAKCFGMKSRSVLSLSVVVLTKPRTHLSTPTTGCAWDG